MKNENENNPTYFAIIPGNVRYDNRLRPNEKLLFGEITALLDTNGSCWATNHYFADLYGKSHVSISTWISNLTKYGYITCEINKIIDGLSYREIRITMKNSEIKI